MVKIVFNKADEWVFNPEAYFDLHYGTNHNCEFMLDDFVKRMILDIDQSEVIDRFVIKSPILGGISPVMLSGSVKTLICMYLEPDVIFNASFCGNSCAKWILEMGKHRDFIIVLRHTMRFPEGFKVYSIDANRVVDSISDLVDIGHPIMANIYD